jgi:hypothetical protein
MRRFVLVIITLLVVFFCKCEAQLIKSYGFKAGVAAESQKWEFATSTTLAVDTKIRPGLDVGIFLEWLDIPYLSILSELHYIQKGAKCTSNVMMTMVDRSSPLGYVDLGYYFTPRLDYLSIPLLMKLRFELPILSVYLLAGPRIDIYLSKHGDEGLMVNKDYQNENIGGTFGFGLETLSLAPFNIGTEFRYSPSFQKSYSSDYFSINNQSMEFLLVIGF